MKSWFWPVVLTTFIVALVASYFLRGETGLKGMGLGLIATTITVGGWWLAISHVAILSKSPEPRASGGTFWVVLTFFLKLPVFFVLGFLAQRIGGNAVSCFLGGLGLVYLALIGWALHNSAHPA